MTGIKPAVRLIDAHCHLNFNAYREDSADVIVRALEQGIGLIAVGSQSSNSAQAVELAEKHDGVWAIIGLHPIHLHEQEVDEEEEAFQSRSEEFDAAAYRRLAASSSKIVALGECGLDYYHLPDDLPPAEVKARQEKVFRAHLDLALELGLPVMIHCRDAHADVIRILGEYADAGTPVRGDIHCFTGSWAEAERYLELGFYISFTGIITFPPRAADRATGKETVQDVVRKTPLERIIVETDAPYLAPVPHRGKRNEPSYVRFVAAEVAKLKKMPVEEIERQTLKNTAELFKLGL